MNLKLLGKDAKAKEMGQVPIPRTMGKSLKLNVPAAMRVVCDLRTKATQARVGEDGTVY